MMLGNGLAIAVCRSRDRRRDADQQQPLPTQEERALGKHGGLGRQRRPQLIPAAIRGDDEAVLALPEEFRGGQTRFRFPGARTSFLAAAGVQRQFVDGPAAVENPRGLQAAEGADARLATRTFDRGQQDLILLVTVHSHGRPSRTTPW